MLQSLLSLVFFITPYQIIHAEEVETGRTNPAGNYVSKRHATKFCHMWVVEYNQCKKTLESHVVAKGICFLMNWESGFVWVVIACKKDYCCYQKTPPWKTATKTFQTYLGSHFLHSSYVVHMTLSWTKASKPQIRIWAKFHACHERSCGDVLPRNFAQQGISM
jgi:hypothetical protein